MVRETQGVNGGSGNLAEGDHHYLMSEDDQRGAQLSEDSSLLLRVSEAQSHLRFTTLQTEDNKAAGVQRGKAI